MRKLTACVLLSACAFVFATGSILPQAQAQAVAPAPAQRVNFTVMQRGSYSGIEQALTKAVHNQTEWQKLWDDHTSTSSGQALPAVDFNKEMVIAIYSGTKATGGHSVSVVKVEDTGKNIVVTYRTTSPRPGGITTQALTQPFVMIKVPASAKPVVFKQAK